METHNKTASLKYIALRGLSGIEKENTIVAFIAAANRNYFGIEADLMLTKDNVFVTCQEKNTSNISAFERIIQDSTYRELVDIPLYELNTQTPKPFLRIPKLNDFLYICKKYKKQAFLFLDIQLSYPQIQNLLDEIDNFDYLKCTTVVSSIISNLDKFRDLSDAIRLQYKPEQYQEELLDYCIKLKAGIVLEYQNLQKVIIDLFHSHNLEVNAWGINVEVNAQELADYNVEYITTNILE